jgi:hypothetical protein
MCLKFTSREYSGFFSSNLLPDLLQIHHAHGNVTCRMKPVLLTVVGRTVAPQKRNMVILKRGIRYKIIKIILSVYMESHPSLDF